MGKIHQTQEADKDAMVLTPGGYRPKSKVHLIEQGHHLSADEGVLRKIHTQSGDVIEEYGPVVSIKEMGPTSRIPKAVSKGVTSGNNLPAPISDGWIVNSGWTNATANPISYFSTKWVVPPSPATNNGQLIYLFNGLQQTTSGPYILQPVLQWGYSDAGGGYYWSVANWYVGGKNDPAFCSTSVQVSPGDILQGVMSLTSQPTPTTFSYLSSFVGLPVADLHTLGIGQLTWACETLECYNLKAFTDYPNTVFTGFYDIEIQLRISNYPVTDAEATLNWQLPDNPVTDNGQKCVIVSNASPGGEVDLYYKAG